MIDNAQKQLTTPRAEAANGDQGSRRSFLLGGTAACAVLGGTMSAFAQSADIKVFTNGTILTVDQDFSVTQAVAIQGNRIVTTGELDAVLAVTGPAATVIDLDGKTMLPGFIDPHTHAVTGAMVAGTMHYVGIASFTTAAEVLNHLKQLAVAATPGEWIVARNFDPGLQTGFDGLTFAELDDVSLEHPVFVLNASGHLGYANSKAFEVAGVAADVPNPEGAEFVRDAAGALTGEIKNQEAFMQVLGAFPALAEANPAELLLDLLSDWSQHGLTTVSELSLGALTGTGDVDIMMAAANSGRLQCRLRAYPFYTVGEEAWDAAGVSQGDGNALARIAGYKLVADGSNQGYTGLQREPYLHDHGSGLAYVSGEDLIKSAVDRASKGWHLSAHGNGDAGIDNVLDAFQAVQDAGIDLEVVRPRIEHCSILNDDQILRMKRLGVRASFLIGHVHFWGVFLRDNVFGEEKVQLLDRCRSVEDAGIGFSLQSDFMVTDPVPLHMIEMAVTRKTWAEPEYVLAPQERITVESAIRALTSEAAYQLYSDHEIGSLEAGKFADFVILEQDPRTVDVDTIKDIKVLQTWMDGKQVYTG